TRLRLRRRLRRRRSRTTRPADRACRRKRGMLKRFSNTLRGELTELRSLTSEGSAASFAGTKREEAMANINVVNLGGEKVGEFELLDEVFAGEINDGLLWEAVVHYRAALRQGTAST